MSRCEPSFSITKLQRMDIKMSWHWRPEWFNTGWKDAQSCCIITFPICYPSNCELDGLPGLTSVKSKPGWYLPVSSATAIENSHCDHWQNALQLLTKLIPHTLQAKPGLGTMSTQRWQTHTLAFCFSAWSWASISSGLVYCLARPLWPPFLPVQKSKANKWFSDKLPERSPPPAALFVDFQCRWDKPN